MPAGFYVLGIDYFFGDPVYIHTEADFDRRTWVEKSILQAKEAVPKWIDAVLQLYGAYLAIFGILGCKTLIAGPEAKYSAVGKRITFDGITRNVTDTPVVVQGIASEVLMP